LWGKDITVFCFNIDEKQKKKSSFFFCTCFIGENLVIETSKKEALIIGTKLSNWDKQERSLNNRHIQDTSIERQLQNFRI